MNPIEKYFSLNLKIKHEEEKSNFKEKISESSIKESFLHCLA